jgi:hypothetical protein
MSFQLRHTHLSHLLTAAGTLVLAACGALSGLACSPGTTADGGETRQEPAPSQSQPSPARSQQAGTTTPAVPARLTPSDLAKLRWLEGSWRGTGDIDKPFYERYRIEEQAVVVEGFEDEAFGQSSGITRFELKDGEMGGGNDGWRWVVTDLSADSITFAPVTKARNSFRWERVSADEWRAVLEWPAEGDKPARRRVYRMERWPPAADPKR